MLEITNGKRKAAALLTAGLLALSGAAATGCGDDNGASEDIENAADEAGEDLSNAADDATDEAGQAADDAANSADEAADDLGKEIDGKPNNDG